MDYVSSPKAAEARKALFLFRYHKLENLHSYSQFKQALLSNAALPSRDRYGLFKYK